MTNESAGPGDGAKDGKTVPDKAADHETDRPDSVEPSNARTGIAGVDRPGSPATESVTTGPASAASASAEHGSAALASAGVEGAEPGRDESVTAGSETIGSQPGASGAVANPGNGVVGLMGRRPGLVRLVGAVVAGLLIYASFPPRTCWYLAPLGIALLTLVVRDSPRLRGGFGYGLLAGLAFFVPLLPWTGIYVGPVPWLALSLACAVYVGLFGLLTRVVGALPGWPVWVAAVWSLTEWGRASFPFGGFPWGRLAFGQGDGWYLPLAWLGGAPGVSFAVALSGTALAALVIAVRGAFAGGTRNRVGPIGSRNPAGRTAIAAAAVGVVIMPLAGLILRAALPAPNAGDRSIIVAAIQGSVPRLGLDFNSQRRAVLDNHVRETAALADAVAAGRAPQPDIVIWPENSSDIDPLRNDDAYAEITAVSQRVHAPILVGAVLLNDDETTTNSVIVWNGAGGPGERHDKKIIQPFGEYLPYRGFFRHFSQYADKAGYFVPGHGDGVVHARPGRGGPPVAIGVATCYEVAFDRAFEDSMHAGAQLLTVPTNNATFGDSEMTYQQLAMSRIRAVEHGRAVVVAATTGVSAIITADGTVRAQTSKFVPAWLESSLPLRHTATPATALGPWPEWILCIVAAIAVATSAIRRRTSPTARPVGSEPIGERAGR